MPGKGQLRNDEAPGVGGCTKGCSLMRKIVLPGSAFLPLSRHEGGGGGSVYSLITTMPNLEGSIRVPRPLPKCQEMVLLGGVEADWLLLTDSMR